MCKISDIHTFEHIIANKLQWQNLLTHCTHFACVWMCKITCIHTFAHIIANKLQLQNLHAHRTHFAHVWNFTFAHIIAKKTPVAKPARISHTLCMCADAYSHFCTHFHNFLQTNSSCNTYFGHLCFCTHFYTQLQKENSHTCMHIKHISHVCECSKFHTWYKVQSIVC